MFVFSEMLMEQRGKLFVLAIKLDGTKEVEAETDVVVFVDVPKSIFEFLIVTRIVGC